jgi:hypothetical protein
VPHTAAVHRQQRKTMVGASQTPSIIGDGSTKLAALRAGVLYAHTTGDFLARIPKTDLHVHLDGSIRLGTLIELAQKHEVRQLARSYHVRSDNKAFIEMNDLHVHLDGSIRLSTLIELAQKHEVRPSVRRSIVLYRDTRDRERGRGREIGRRGRGASFLCLAAD